MSGQHNLAMMGEALFNTPLAISVRKAEIICAVLAGKMNISSIESEFGTRNREQMEALVREERIMMAAAKKMSRPNGSRGGGTSQKPYPMSASGIALIGVQGTLTRTWGLDPSSGKTGYDGIWAKLQASEADPDVRGQWFGVNSGGGAVDGLFDLTDAIWSLSARNGGKPKAGFAGDHAYSAAYGILAACDYRWTPETGGVGSVGTIMLVPDFSQAMENDGVKVHVIRSPDRKAIGIGGMEAQDEESLKQMQGEIDATTQIFQGRVGAYLATSPSRAAGLKTKVAETRGLTYMGAQAKAVGFVSDVLSEQEAWSKFERMLTR